MATKKKPAAKAEKPIPAGAARGRALDVARFGLAVEWLVEELIEAPANGAPSRLDRLVVAAERQADARQRIAATFEAAEARKARESAAEEKRAAEMHTQELKAAADHVATVRDFFARLDGRDVRVTSTGASGGPELAFGAPPPAAPVSPTDPGTPPQA